MHSKPVLVLLAATALVAGCKSAAPTAPAPTTPTAAAPGPVPSTSSAITDACDVLTPAEISSALGVPIDPGRHTAPASSIMCVWSQTKVPQNAHPQRLILNFTATQAFQREKTATTNVTITAAPGVGDDAFYASSKYGTSFYLLKNGTAVSFALRNLHLKQADEWAKDKALGLDAAARL